jgi:hypothetical protein
MRIAPLESRLPVVIALAVAALLACALEGAVAQPARADVGEAIILRCTHNQSLSGFSQAAYRKALEELEADLEEYSGCSSKIRQAELAAASGGRGGTGVVGQSSAPLVAIAATPAEQRAIAHAEHGPEPVKLTGGVIHPGVVHVDIASALSSLPTPLLATLAFLLACLLAVVGGALRNRVRAGRSR